MLKSENYDELQIILENHGLDNLFVRIKDGVDDSPPTLIFNVPSSITVSYFERLLKHYLPDNTIQVISGFNAVESVQTFTRREKQKWRDVLCAVLPDGDKCFFGIHSQNTSGRRNLSIFRDESCNPKIPTGLHYSSSGYAVAFLESDIGHGILNAISAAEDIIDVPNAPRSLEQVWDAAINDWLNIQH
jgi:hypothetical protein